MLRCFLHDLNLLRPLVAVVTFGVIPMSVLTGGLPITVDETLRLVVARTNRLPLDTYVLNATRGKTSLHTPPPLEMPTALFVARLLVARLLVARLL
eukprot:5162657-Pleurochrysis_carterae.AAC.1